MYHHTVVVHAQILSGLPRNLQNYVPFNLFKLLILSNVVCPDLFLSDNHMKSQEIKMNVCHHTVTDGAHTKFPWINFVTSLLMETLRFFVCMELLLSSFHIKSQSHET